MKFDIKKPFKLIFFALLVLTIYTGATTADLFDNLSINDNKFSATTLDFSQRDTSNNNPTTVLFNLTGLVPGGFKVDSIRIKKDGAMKFKYHMSTVTTSGDATLCQALELTVVKDWVVKYQGKLIDLSYDSDIEDKELDDWIFYINLKYNGQEVKNKTCNFNFVFKSWKNEVNETRGFWDQEILSNHVTTGTWK